MKNNFSRTIRLLIVFCNAILLTAQIVNGDPEQAQYDPDRLGIAEIPLINDIAIVTSHDEASRPSRDKLWGKDLPAGIDVSTDAHRLHGVMAKQDYLIKLISSPLSNRPNDLAAYRAVVIPDQAPLSKEDGNLLRQYVKNGGTVIGFAHASLLDPKGEIRKDYLLADVFGVHSEGRAESPVEARPAMSSDSIFARIYGPAQTIDGKRDFWASADKPMPHWVQMDFPQPKEIARVDVSSRDGGYLLHDFNLQVLKNRKWVTVKSVRKNGAKRSVCAFDKPVTTSSLRLLVSKELINGKDRQIADVGEIEPYGAAGRKIISQPYKIEARISDKAWTKAYKSSRIKIRSPVMRMRLDAARPLAFFADPQARGGELPFCTVNNFGKGKAYLFAVPEAIFRKDETFWFTLLRLFVGQPTLRHSGDANLRAYLIPAEGGRVLYLVDHNPKSPPKGQGRKVIVRINCGILGDISSAAILPKRKSISLKKRGEWVQFVVPVGPVTMVELKGR